MKWNIKKIQDYIKNQIEESLHLDYKSAGSLDKNDRKKIEISKDVSSFANSDGGIIIYGISEFDDKDKGHLPKEITPINRVEYTKEWLEQIIHSYITPRIQNLKIYPISTDEIEKNTAIYVVEIPKSNTVHQAKDKKYYKRFNFMSTPMEDYEIKDIFNRINKTNIEISFEPHYKDKDYYDEIIKEKREVDIQTEIWATNKGNKVTEILQVFIKGKNEISEFIIKPYFDKYTQFEIILDNTEERKIIINDEEQVVSKERIPILPKTSRYLGDFHFNSKLLFNDMSLIIQIATEDNSKMIKLKGKDILTLNTP